MGKLNSSLLSGSNGRVGRVVVANVGGIEILRHCPRKRTVTPTAKQLLIQQRMKNCYTFLSSYKHFASMYFGKKIGLRSPYNQAMSNLLNSFELDFVKMKLNPLYADILFSQGKLLQPIPTGVTSLTPNTLTVNWNDNSGGNPLRESDFCQILCTAAEETRSVFLEN